MRSPKLSTTFLGLSLLFPLAASSDSLQEKQERFDRVFPDLRLGMNISSKEQRETQREYARQRREKLANNPLEQKKWKWRELATAIVFASDNELKTQEWNTEGSLKTAAITVLGRRPNKDTIETLISQLDYKIFRMGPDTAVRPRELRPALDMVVEIGDSAVPALISIGVSKDTPEAIRDLALGVIPKIIYDKSRSLDHISETKSLFNQYANEYVWKAGRYLALSKQIGRLAAEKQPKLPKQAAPLEEEPILSQDAQIERLISVLENQEVLVDEKLLPADEPKVIQSIEALAKLDAIRALPLLADKLDWERPAPLLNEEGKPIPAVMYAEPQGLLSPAITQAATKAILQIGPKALPTLIDAIAMRGRGSRFRANALPLIVQLAGGKAEAEKLLVQAAEDDTKKAERLREMADSLPKVR